MPDRDTSPADLPPSDADSRATIARLAQDTLPRLIERLARSDLGELEVREDGWRIRLRRPTAGSNAAQPADDVRAHHAGGPGGTYVERAAISHRQSAPRGDTARGTVTSPAVGYFAARDGVAAGAAVRRGDVLGYVDVLGVRHEVVAPLDGVVREMEVEPGQAIEYGQRLGRVEPDA